MTSVATDESGLRIADRLQSILLRVATAAEEAGRSADDVALLAVTKGQSIADIRAAHRAGLELFAENYLAEALPKIKALEDLKPCWHFIGRVQSNKTAALSAHFDWLQSLDRLKIARRLAEQRPPALAALNVCVQVNLDREPQKAGVAPADVLDLCRQLVVYPRLKLRGLMAIPERTLSKDRLHQAFRALAQLHRQVSDALPEENLDTLSMGMSDDFEVAIAEGSSMVRIGTALLGPRKPAEPV